METKEFDYVLLRYGTIVTDEEYQQISSFKDNIEINKVRTRIIKYGDKIFYHKMVDGELRILFELK